MLDQSFSTKNLETIYSLESRKGNIDIQTMPQVYCDVLASLKELRNTISDIKKNKDKTEEITLDIETKSEIMKNLVEQKKEILHNYLNNLSKQINAHSFRFSLNKFITDEHKEVFTMDVASHAHFFAIKQLQYNIRNTFKVKQSNRHNILSNIKSFLNSNIPIYIIRTDISSFYESIPHEILMHKVFNNTLLSNKSKAFIKGIFIEYEKLKDKTLVPPNQGVPRGIGISSYLSELYMKDIDTYIKNRPEVMFYARYVDDIFIILTTLPVGVSLQEYYTDITNYFKTQGLSLKQPNDDSDKCRLIDFSKENHVERPMNYLGYCLYMERRSKKLSVKYGLSDKKKERYHKKLDKIINHFRNLCKLDIRKAYSDLFDSLNMITGNYKLFKSKSSVKVGLYYSNDLLDCKEGLDKLTIYLKDLVNDLDIYAKLNNPINIKNNLIKHISNIDFYQRWETRKMYSFNIQRIQELEKWLQEEKR